MTEPARVRSKELFRPELPCGVALALSKPSMGFSRRLSAWLFLACFCLMSWPAGASTVIFRTDAQLVALSERVVHGRVVAKRTTRGGPQGLRIYTVTTLQIIEDLTGVDGDTVEVWELGGAVDGEYMHVGGAVEFRLGEEVLVCLERGPQGLRHRRDGVLEVRRVACGQWRT